MIIILLLIVIILIMLGVKGAHVWAVLKWGCLFSMVSLLVTCVFYENSLQPKYKSISCGEKLTAYTNKGELLCIPKKK